LIQAVIALACAVEPSEFNEPEKQPTAAAALLAVVELDELDALLEDDPAFPVLLPSPLDEQPASAIAAAPSAAPTATSFTLGVLLVRRIRPTGLSICRD
jgi:hypothetical protein